ncbi:MAG: hypothetical protein GX585_05035, partial [Clostridiales bacterium]|nr:hypothetical protein [Clostridiales bacterium]
MLSRSNLILTTPPTTAGTALTFGLPVGHMAYRIGSGPHLFRANMPISVRGGLMVVDDASCDGRGNGDAFCQEVIRECVARGFDGVIFDFERRPMPLLQRIVHSLAPLMARRGWSLYVPESYGRDSDVAKVII